MKTLACLVCLVALLFTAATAPAADRDIDGKNPPRVEFTGVVKHIDLEGGFFGIVADKEGGNFYPLNLPKEFAKDGVRVKVVAHKRDDVATTAQWGQIIEIKSIAAAK